MTLSYFINIKVKVMTSFTLDTVMLLIYLALDKDNENKVLLQIYAMPHSTSAKERSCPILIWSKQQFILVCFIQLDNDTTMIPPKTKLKNDCIAMSLIQFQFCKGLPLNTSLITFYSVSKGVECKHIYFSCIV